MSALVLLLDSLGTLGHGSVLAQSSQQNPWPKLIIFAIVAGFSFITWVVKQLKIQAEKRRLLASRQRLEQESLRTGRDLGRASDTQGYPSPSRSEPSPLADAAARREARLQELRRRREQALQQSGRSTVPTVRIPTGAGPAPGQPIDINLGGTILRIPGSTGPTVPGTRSSRPPQAPARPPTRPPARPTSQPRPQLTPQQAAELRRRQSQQRTFEAKRSADQPARGAQAAARHDDQLRRQADVRNANARRADQSQLASQARRAEAARAARASDEGVSGEDPVHLLVKPDPETPARPAKAALRGAAVTLRGPDLRRAIILREILGPPISMR